MFFETKQIFICIFWFFATKFLALSSNKQNNVSISATCVFHSIFHLVNYSNSYRALISKYIWLSIGNDNYFAVNFTGAKVIHVDKCARSKRMEIKPSNQSILSMNVNVWVKVWFVIELIRWRYIKGECPAHSIELIIKVFIVSDDSKSKSCSKYVFQVS